MADNKSSGFSTVEVLLIVVIVAILGFTGWFVYHSKKAADMNLNPDTSTANPGKTSDKPVTLPDGWSWYQGDGFKFGYPKEYGSFTASRGDLAGGVKAYWISGTTDQPTFAGLIKTDNFALSKYGAPADSPITARKYGPKVKLSGDKWVVTDDNPSDPKKYKTGDTYPEVKKVVTGKTSVYEFTSGDEGVVYHTVAFTAGGRLYTLLLPGFDLGTYGSPAQATPNDQKPYDTLASDIAKTVVVG